MLTIKPHDQKNILHLVAEGKFNADDFQKITPEVDHFIKQHEKTFILMDASAMIGWENFKAVQAHLSFVKKHHKSVAKVALVAGKFWQHWLAKVGSLLLSPDVKVFDDYVDAVAWLLKD